MTTVGKHNAPSARHRKAALWTVAAIGAVDIAGGIAITTAGGDQFGTMALIAVTVLGLATTGSLYLCEKVDGSTTREVDHR